MGMATPPLAYRTTRVTISGTFAGGVEEWSTGFWFGAENEDAALPDQALADGIRNLWQTFFTNPQTYISSNYQSTLVKCASVGTDGKSDANDTIYATFPTGTQGVSATHMPPQIALVATLTGANARGLASKGRMYLPGVGVELAAGGHINEGKRNYIADHFKTFLDGVNALPHNNVIQLASHGQLNKDGTPKIGGYGPINKAVKGFKIGSVYDTQRRRRNGIAESYNIKTLA
jgi:hypothetical protein